MFDYNLSRKNGLLDSCFRPLLRGVGLSIVIKRGKAVSFVLLPITPEEKNGFLASGGTGRI